MMRTYLYCELRGMCWETHWYPLDQAMAIRWAQRLYRRDYDGLRLVIDGRRWHA